MGIILGVLVAGLLMPISVFAQDGGITSELERTASTSPQEKVQYATDANLEMRAAVKSISKLLESARRDSNLEALQCLNNRLTSVRALVQVSEAAETSMKQALSDGEVEKADHEFRKITVALTKTRQLLAESERCTDEGGAEDQATTREVINNGVNSGDELDEPDDGTTPYDWQDPPKASPFY